MARFRIPETFRCSVSVRGEQCPCEMTTVNTFTYSLKSLDRKAEREGKKVDGAFLAANAICPWHARFLKNLRKDIFRMAIVADLAREREQLERRKAAYERNMKVRDERLESFFAARQPRLAVALKQAGVAQL